ncbi:BolA/IbaG family iron-sulfur metabolism protein [Escherichia coli]|nr:BolA/IbaG family iron-sulfur metabolism protein [Escherichia coli]
MFCLVKFFQAGYGVNACPANLPASRALSDLSARLFAYLCQRNFALRCFAGLLTDHAIQSVLINALSPQDGHLPGDGSHFQVIAVGELFDGMSRVKKQQTVYGPLMEYIADNRIHAVSIKAYTPAEWARDRKLNGF